MKILQIHNGLQQNIYESNSPYYHRKKSIVLHLIGWSAYDTVVLIFNLPSSSVNFPHFPLLWQVMPKRRLHPSKSWIRTVPIAWLEFGIHEITVAWIHRCTKSRRKTRVNERIVTWINTYTRIVPWVESRVLHGIIFWVGWEKSRNIKRSIWRDWFNIRIKSRGKGVHLSTVFGMTFCWNQGHIFPGLMFISVISVLLVERQYCTGPP